MQAELRILWEDEVNRGEGCLGLEAALMNISAWVWPALCGSAEVDAEVEVCVV